MITHQMKLTVKPFGKIKDGKKIIESRLYDEKRKQINIGDNIDFVCVENPSKKILTRVKAIYRYKLFNELFSDFPPQYFGGKSKEELLEEIEKFYSKKEQQKYGVVGFMIELVK